ncbi:acetyltransferase [Nitrosopumilus sp. b1]|uniref:acyltransferase n=1 Tax=Nitrosopumilus sp. b1 TaxID=2109907 RepID=UPI0015F4DCA3|nr:acyltransferase [Nitrosopumilus sp. b1]KAF6244001.1 acetyltransferase [Nitrosopumilus sp. b1]
MKSNSEKWKKPVISHGKMTKYNYIVQYPENLKLGKNFDIGEFTYINSQFGVIIEDNVQIGSHCSIYSNSTIDEKHGAVNLKKNCKIGTHSTVMPNVTIHENSVIAAHSYVNTNVPKNQMWGGVPAKLIKNLGY